MDEKESQLLETESTVPADVTVEEFSIVELEDRLEMADIECCNNNCGCPPAP